MERCARPPSSTVEEILRGPVWNMISLLLMTDDVVKVRAGARRWNVGGGGGWDEGADMGRWETTTS